MPGAREGVENELVLVGELDLHGARVAVVIPAFRVARQIEQVIENIPASIESIIVVDDFSPDDTGARVRALDNPRVTLLTHEANQGVGGAMVTGFKEALRQGADIVVKMDGDDQMNPAELPGLIAPLISGQTDMVKGNRYHSLESMKRVPPIRMLGNSCLTFLVKLASGYWNEFDPANGYFAVRADLLQRLDLDHLPRRYFFESGFLIELGIHQAVIGSVPMRARYGDETSSLSILHCILTFPPRLLFGLFRRVFWRYFVHDFSAVSVFLLIGLPACISGASYGMSVWSELEAKGQFTSAGQVMLAAMPIILGFQLILQAIVLDIQNVPSRPLCEPLPLASGKRALSSEQGALELVALDRGKDG